VFPKMLVLISPTNSNEQAGPHYANTQHKNITLKELYFSHDTSDFLLSQAPLPHAVMISVLLSSGVT